MKKRTLRSKLNYGKRNKVKTIEDDKNMQRLF